MQSDQKQTYAESVLVFFCNECDRLYNHIMYITHNHVSKSIELNNLIKKPTDTDKILVTDKALTLDTDKTVTKDEMQKQKNRERNKKRRQNKKKTVSTISRDDEDYKDLTDVQLEVLQKSFMKAKIYHNSVYQNVVIRFIDLGYTEADIKPTLDYLRNVKLISHIGRMGTPSWLRTDTKMRNTFEVQNRTDLSRVSWEDNLFFKLYKKDCPFESRVKYGCLNLLNQPEGCRSALSYGQSYIIFKENVKKRTTIVCGDSANRQQHLCTFEHCVQLLLYMQQETLRCVIERAKGSNDHKIMNHHYTYIEAQIHGDVIFTRDIESIVLHRNHATHDITNHLTNVGIQYVIQ